MKQKLIFLDIDGTLIQPGQMEAPQSAVQAIHQAQANGHKVFLCTGRNYNMTSPLLKYGFDGYVCSAGGYVVCDGIVLNDYPMTPEQRDNIRSVFERNGISCTMEAKNTTFGDERMRARFAHYQERMAANLNSEAERWRKAFASGMLVRPIEEYKGEPIYKICYMCDSQAQLQEARELLTGEFIFCEQHGVGVKGLINGELINRAFNKGQGIQRICDHLGVDIADTIGFGDSVNDREMCEVVGVSVCMANGTEELKAICDRICPTVSEDGIAKEFKALGLID